MVSKNTDDYCGTEVDLRDIDFDRRVAIERRMDTNGVFLRPGFRLHNRQMGEAAKVILNVFGFTGIIFAFIANLKIAPVLSYTLAVISILWALFRMLKMMEDWLIRRAERKQIYRDGNKKRSA